MFIFRFFSTSLLILFIALAACSQTDHQLDPDQFEKKLQGTEEIQLVDVRTGEEFHKSHIEGALNMNINSKDFASHVKTLDQNKPVLVYCFSGPRSTKAAAYMRKQGFTSVYELKGGMMSWNAKKKPSKGVSNGPGMAYNKFHEHVSQDKMVLVDFYAKWCAPCKKMAPELQALQEEYGDKLVLLKIDADTNKELMSDLDVQALPTLKLYKNGEQIWSHTGYLGKNEIEKNIAGQL